MIRLPVNQSAGPVSPGSGGSGALFLPLPGHKFVLRGMTVDVGASNTSSGVASFNINGFVDSTSLKMGVMLNGSYTINFLPSTTQWQHFSQEWPDEVVETIGYPIDQIQGPQSEPWAIEFALSATGTDTFGVYYSYWGYQVAVV